MQRFYLDHTCEARGSRQSTCWNCTPLFVFFISLLLMWRWHKCPFVKTASVTESFSPGRGHALGDIRRLAMTLTPLTPTSNPTQHTQTHSLCRRLLHTTTHNPLLQVTSHFHETQGQSNRSCESVFFFILVVAEVLQFLFMCLELKKTEEQHLILILGLIGE